MATLPYMNFYVADYLADTIHLDTLEHGAYILLIFHYWKHGKPLPNDDEKLAKLCRLSLKKFQKIKKNILEFFSIENDFLIHERIEIELSKAREKSLKASDSGKKSAENRRIKKLMNGQRSHNDSSTFVERTPNYLELELDIYNDDDDRAREEILAPTSLEPPDLNPENPSNLIDMQTVAAWRQYTLNKGFPVDITDSNQNRLFIDLAKNGITQAEMDSIIANVNKRKGYADHITSINYYYKPVTKFIAAKQNPAHADDVTVSNSITDKIKQEIFSEAIWPLKEGIEHIKLIFRTFAKDLYREKWLYKIHSKDELKELIDVWQESLARFDEQQVKGAITEIKSGKTKYGGFAPNPHEFAALCATKAKIFAPLKISEDKPLSPEAKKKCSEELRKLSKYLPRIKHE